MTRAAATFGGVLVLALVAGALTEATLAVGHRGSLANDALLRPLYGRASPTPKTATPTSTPTPSATPAATPAPTPTPAAVPSAVTNSFVHLRAGKSTSTAIVTDLNGGTTVQLLPDSDVQWQQVQTGGFTGYVFKTYLNY